MEKTNVEKLDPEASNTKPLEAIKTDISVNMESGNSVIEDSAIESVQTVNHKVKPKFGIVDILNLTESDQVNDVSNIPIEVPSETERPTSVTIGMPNVTVASSNISSLTVEANSVKSEVTDLIVGTPSMTETSCNATFGTTSVTVGLTAVTTGTPSMTETTSNVTFGTSSFTVGPADVATETPSSEKVPSYVIAKTSGGVDDRTSDTLMDSPYKAQVVDFDSKLPCTLDPQNPMLKNLMSPPGQGNTLSSFVSPTYCVQSTITTPDVQKIVIDKQEGASPGQRDASSSFVSQTYCVQSTITTPDVQKTVIDRQEDLLRDAAKQTLPASSIYPVVEGGDSLPSQPASNSYPVVRDGDSLPSQPASNIYPVVEGGDSVPAQPASKFYPVVEGGDSVPAQPASNKYPVVEGGDSVPAQPASNIYPVVEGGDSVPAQPASNIYPVVEGGDSVPAQPASNIYPVVEGGDSVPAQPASNIYPVVEGGDSVPAQQAHPYLGFRYVDTMAGSGTYNANIERSVSGKKLTQAYLIPDDSDYCKGGGAYNSIPLSNAQNETYSAVKVEMNNLLQPSKYVTSSSERCGEFVQIGEPNNVYQSNSYYSTRYQSLVQSMDVISNTQSQNYATWSSSNQDIYLPSSGNTVDAPDMAKAVPVIQSTYLVGSQPTMLNSSVSETKGILDNRISENLQFLGNTKNETNKLFDHTIKEMSEVKNITNNVTNEVINHANNEISNNRTSEVTDYTNIQTSEVRNHTYNETSKAVNCANSETDEVLYDGYQVTSDGRIPNRLTVLKTLGTVVHEGAKVKTKTSLGDFLKNGGSKLRPEETLPEVRRRVTKPRKSNGNFVNPLLAPQPSLYDYTSAQDAQLLYKHDPSFERPVIVPGPSMYTFTSPSDAQLVYQNMDLLAGDLNKKRDGTMNLVNKVLEKEYSGQTTEIRYCDCPISAERFDVPVEQVFIRDGQMYQLPDANVVRIGKFEFYAFLKEGSFYIPVGNFIRVVGRDIRIMFLSVVDLKNLLTLTSDEVCLLEQKCNIYFDNCNKDLIDLVTLQKICMKLVSVCPDNVTLKMLAFSIPCQKQLGSQMRCSKCGLAKQGRVRETTYIPLTHTGDQTPKISASVGTLKIGDKEFASFELGSGTYFSFKDIVKNRIMSVPVLQERMKKINSKAIVAPKGVENYFWMHSCHVDHTLWIDTVTLRCLVCMSAMKKYSKLVSMIARGEYSYSPACNLLCEDTSKFETVYAINAKTQTLEENNGVRRSSKAVLPFSIAVTKRKNADSAKSAVDSTTGDNETRKDTEKSVVAESTKKDVQVEEVGSNVDSSCPRGTEADIGKEQADDMQVDENSQDNKNFRMNLRPRKKKESPIKEDFLVIFSSSTDNEDCYDSDSKSRSSGSISKKTNKANKEKGKSHPVCKAQIILKAGDYIVSDYDKFCEKLDAGLIVKRENGDVLVGLNSEEKQAAAVLEESLEEEQNERCTETEKADQLNLLNQAIQLSGISTSHLEQDNKLNEVESECQSLETMKSGNSYFDLDSDKRVEVNVEDNICSRDENESESCTKNQIIQDSDCSINIGEISNNSEEDKIHQKIIDDKLTTDTSHDLEADEEVKEKASNDDKMVSVVQCNKSDRGLLPQADLKIYSPEKEGDSGVSEHITEIIEDCRNVDFPKNVTYTKENIDECYEMTEMSTCREASVEGANEYSIAVKNIKEERIENCGENNKMTEQKVDRTKGKNVEMREDDPIEFHKNQGELALNYRQGNSPEKADNKSEKAGIIGESKSYDEKQTDPNISPVTRQMSSEKLHPEPVISTKGTQTKIHEGGNIEKSPNGRKTNVNEAVILQTGVSPDGEKNVHQPKKPQIAMSPDNRITNVHEGIKLLTEISPDRREVLSNEEKQKEMEMNIKRYLIFMYVKEGSSPGFRVKKFQNGAEKVFPDLFLPDPEDPETKQKRIKFMIAAARYMDDMFQKHKQQKQQLLEQRKQAEEVSLVKTDQDTASVDKCERDGASGAQGEANSKDKHSDIACNNSIEKVADTGNKKETETSESHCSVDSEKSKDCVLLREEAENHDVEKENDNNKEKVEESSEEGLKNTVSKQKDEIDTEPCKDSVETLSRHCNRQRKGKRRKHQKDGPTDSSKRLKLDNGGNDTKSKLQENTEKSRCYSVRTRKDKAKESEDIEEAKCENVIDNENGQSAKKTSTKNRDEAKYEAEKANQTTVLNEDKCVKTDNVVEEKKGLDDEHDRDLVHCQLNSVNVSLGNTQADASLNSCLSDTPKEQPKTKRKTRSQNKAEQTENEISQTDKVDNKSIDVNSYRKEKSATYTRGSLTMTSRRNKGDSMMSDRTKLELSDCYVLLKRIKLLDDAVLSS